MVQGQESQPTAVQRDLDETISRQQPTRISLLDQMTANGPTDALDPAHSASVLHRFHAATTVADALKHWLGTQPTDAEALRETRRILARDIARIDQLLGDQVNAILHTPAFQTLESAWRGLLYLWTTREKLIADGGFDEQLSKVELRILDVSKKELKKDFEKAAEFDQNSLFQKVYEEEFGTAGGTPYGTLIANYEFSNHPDDLDLLSELSGVGAASFAPVITGASPALIGLDDFSDLEKPVDLSGIFQQARHQKWTSLRDRVDTQFLGLTLPRVLMRAPYLNDGEHRHGFRFNESTEGENRSAYLWGTSAWAMGAVVMRAFITCGWFADIRGVERGVEGGGLVTGLPTHSFHTDALGVAARSSTEVAVSDLQEAELCDLGFIPLSHCKDTPYSVFYSNQSVHNVPGYDDPLATANARISAMLQYVLCCSRIAHYLKIRARDKLGAMSSPMEIQNELGDWLVDYVTPDERASPEMKARYPLREAEVKVTEKLGKPGEYMLTIRLLPHYQLDQLSSSMTLVARRVDLQK